MEGRSGPSSAAMRSSGRGKRRSSCCGRSWISIRGSRAHSSLAQAVGPEEPADPELQSYDCRERKQAETSPTANRDPADKEPSPPMGEQAGSERRPDSECVISVYS